MTLIAPELAAKVLEVVDAGLCSGVGNPTPGEMCVEAAVCYAMGLPHGDDPPCVSRALRKLKIGLNDASWSSREARARGMRRLAVAQLGTRDTLDDDDFAICVALLVVNRVVPRVLRAAALTLPDDKRASLETAAIVCESATDLTAAAIAAHGARSAAYAAADAAYAADAAADVAYAAATAATAAAYAADAADAAYAAATAARAAAYAADAARAAATAAAYAAYAADAAAEGARDEQLSLFAEEVVQILIEMKSPGSQFLYLTEPQK